MKITKLQSELQGALSARAAHIESMTNQKNGMQRSLMACALSADPATSALQYLFGAKNVFAVHRAEAHARQRSICVWIESAFCRLHQNVVRATYGATATVQPCCVVDL
jgi:hypothetical protein